MLQTDTKEDMESADMKITDLFDKTYKSYVLLKQSLPAAIGKQISIEKI